MAQKQKLDLDEKVRLIKSYQSGKQGLRRPADLAGQHMRHFDDGQGVMKQGRETTLEERTRIAKECIACGKNYGEMAYRRG